MSSDAHLPLGAVFLDVEGLSLTDRERDLLAHPQVGGVIFFARNYQDRSQLGDLVSEIRNIRPNLLLAVDQEGGRVQRLKTEFTRIPPMQSFQSIKNGEERQKLLTDAGWLLAAEVLSTGIDFSFTPVLDVDDCFCQVIADRSFSANPEQVAEFAHAFIDGLHEAGMAVTGKHFPGHGSVSGDSHHVLPTDDRELDEIVARDILPFQRLSQQLDAVMPAHIVFSKVDNNPVGFSKIWLQKQLRQALNFNGVIFSDDLSMEGAAIAGTYEQRADQALDAGCDMVLVCNNPQAAEKVVVHLERRNQPSAVRAKTMAAKQRWDWQVLQKDSRWQATAQALSVLCK